MLKKIDPATNEPDLRMFADHRQDHPWILHWPRRRSRGNSVRVPRSRTVGWPTPT